MIKLLPYMAIVRNRPGITCRFAVPDCVAAYLSGKELLNIYIENGGTLILDRSRYDNSPFKDDITMEEVELKLAKRVYGVYGQKDLPIEAFEILRNVEWA